MQELQDGDRFDAIVIGGSQAGLAAGYHLRRHGLRFVILDAHARIGDAWRSRWDTLRLFTPGRYDNLPGMPFPGDRHAFPTKDQVADYLDAYAGTSICPSTPASRSIGCRRRRTDRGSSSRPETGCSSPSRSCSRPARSTTRGCRTAVARDLDPGILQLHSSEYRRPSQLRDGPVLVVGAANSGSEIALDIARAGGRRRLLAGRDTGHLPVRPRGPPRPMARSGDLVRGQPPPDRPLADRAQGASDYSCFRGHPVERARPSLLAAAGVERVVGRVDGVGRRPARCSTTATVLDVANVVWCTGYRRDYSWIEPSITDADGWPVQERGVVAGVAGLYIVGLPFETALASALLGGVWRDAAYVGDRVAERAALARTRAPAGAMPTGTVV